MSTFSPSPWQRPLQILAVALGVALAALLVAWVRMEPLAPTVAPGPVPSRPEATTADGPRVQPDASRPTPQIALARAEGTPEVDAPAASGAVLFGSVLRADRSPVKTGSLFVYRADKHVGIASLRDGTFAFTGLQPGVHRVTSRIDDELPLEQEVALTAPTTRLDLVLATPWLLAVNLVTPAGTPLLDDLRQQVKGQFFRGLLACASCVELDFLQRCGGALDEKMPAMQHMSREFAARLHAPLLDLGGAGVVNHADADHAVVGLEADRCDEPLGVEVTVADRQPIAVGAGRQLTRGPPGNHKADGGDASRAGVRRADDLDIPARAKPIDQH